MDKDLNLTVEETDQINEEILKLTILTEFIQRFVGSILEPINAVKFSYVNYSDYNYLKSINIKKGTLEIFLTKEILDIALIGKGITNLFTEESPGNYYIKYADMLFEKESLEQILAIAEMDNSKQRRDNYARLLEFGVFSPVSLSNCLKQELQELVAVVTRIRNEINKLEKKELSFFKSASDQQLDYKIYRDSQIESYKMSLISISTILILLKSDSIQIVDLNQNKTISDLQKSFDLYEDIPIKLIKANFERFASQLKVEIEEGDLEYDFNIKKPSNQVISYGDFKYYPKRSRLHFKKYNIYLGEDSASGIFINNLLKAQGEYVPLSTMAQLLGLYDPKKDGAFNLKFYEQSLKDAKQRISRTFGKQYNATIKKEVGQAIRPSRGKGYYIV